MMLFAVVLLVASIGLATLQRSRARDALDASLTTAAEQQANTLEGYFERARAVALLTANNPAFADFYAEPGERQDKILAGEDNIEQANRALTFLESLYSDGFGSASFIDRSGAENAQIVFGQITSPLNLSTDEGDWPYFEPTFDYGVGTVYQATPYVNSDTRKWVISSSTQVPTEDGRPHAIVGFEITVESFRQAAAAVAPDDVRIQIVEGSTGAAMIDSRVPASVDARLTQPGQDFAWIETAAGPSGISHQGGAPAAWARLTPTDGNANDWYVVATPLDGLSAFSGFGPATLTMVLLSIVLFGVALRSYRTQDKELLDAASTDALTGLGNRRKLQADLATACREGGSDGFQLALFDLDGFKTYNDTFGHPAGDALLARLGEKLRRVSTGRARIYRMGGDEFCLLTTGPHEERVDIVTAAMLSLTEHGDGFEIGCSHGTVSSDEIEDADDALRIADKRMYAEKHARRLTAETQSRDVLLRALQERYPELGEHRDEVAKLAERTGERLGLEGVELAQVRRAAELHDVGKVAIPEDLLHKPGPLTEQEWAFIQRHSEIGERILAAAPSLAPVGKIIAAHHERWDGAGYPRKLQGADIPIGARIVAVVDSYHAMMTTNREYREPRTREEAIGEIQRCSGTQFDPEVADVFCALVGEEHRRAHATSDA